jgi:hypothetical protein
MAVAMIIKFCFFLVENRTVQHAIGENVCINGAILVYTGYKLAVFITVSLLKILE